MPEVKDSKLIGDLSRVLFDFHWEYCEVNNLDINEEMKLWEAQPNIYVNEILMPRFEAYLMELGESDKMRQLKILKMIAEAKFEVTTGMPIKGFYEARKAWELTSKSFYCPIKNREIMIRECFRCFEMPSKNGDCKTFQKYNKKFAQEENATMGRGKKEQIKEIIKKQQKSN